MARVFLSWYDQLSRAYDKCVAALHSSTYTDGTPLEQKDIRPFASTLMLRTALCIDFGVPVSEALRHTARLIGLYYGNIDDLFADSKDLIGFVRNQSGWDLICPWMMESVEPRLELVKVLTWFPFWREEVSQFRSVHSILNYLTKQTFERQSLEDAAQLDYINGENNIVTSYDGFGMFCIWKMQEHFAYWFEDWDVSQISKGLSFSSGSTAEPSVKSDLALKVRALQECKISTRLGSLVKRDLPNLYHELNLESRLVNMEDVCEVKFVPKNALKRRTIGMERPIINFFQNGLNKALLKAPHFPRKHIRLKDQSYSRNQALKASANRVLATVDFSAASDSVTLELVQRLTSTCDYRLFQWLDATRSSIALLPSGEKMRMRKFAAMGSVTCFTIESLVFLSMAKVACDLAGCSMDDVVVYGDDVILPVEALADFQCIAEALHFKINADKTFSEGDFREACGIFAFKGVDVTDPSSSRKRFDCFSAKADSRSDDTVRWKSAVTAVSMANTAYERGLFFFRYCLVRSLVLRRVRFLSGGITQVPLGVWTQFERNDEWWRKITPKCPLFVYSDYEGVHLVEGEDQWLEEPSDLRSLSRFKLARVVQSYEDGPLPIPRTVFFKGVTVERNFKGFTADAGFARVESPWSDEQRLEVWLYNSRFSEREPLHSSKGIDLPFRKPLTVARGTKTRFEINSHKVEV